MTAPSSSPPAAPTYAAAIYWDKRYEERCQNFDWFFTYGALGKVISTFLGPYKSQPCLHVGCGNSTLQHGMAADGFDCVVNVDISSIVIEQMALQDQHRLPQLRYEVADCRDMSNLPSASFGSILDKGTLDAVLCGQGGTADTHMYLAEVDRLLVPGGTFLLVSLAGPSTRQHLLKGPPRAPWSCQVLLLPKPSMYLASEASLTGRNISCSQAHSADSKDDPVEVDGPYTLQEVVQKVSDPAGTQGSVEGRDYFYCYVCRKPGGASAPEGEAVATVVANGLAHPTTTLTPSHPPFTSDPAAMGPVSAAPQPAAPTVPPTQPTPHRAAPQAPLPPATLAPTAATATLPPTAATTTLAGLERLSLSSPGPHTSCPSFAVPSGFSPPGDIQLGLSSTNLLTHKQAPHPSAADPDAGTGPTSLPPAPHLTRMRLSDPALPPAAAAAAAAAEQVGPDAHPFLAPGPGFWRHSGLFARPKLPAPPLLMEEDQLQLMLALPSSCKVRRSCSGWITGGLTATAGGGGLVQEGGGRGPGPDRPSEAQADQAACPDLSSLHPLTAAAAAAAAGKLSSPGLAPRGEAGSRSAAPSVCERSHTVAPPPVSKQIEAWGSATAAPPPAPMAPLASPPLPAPASSTPSLGLAGGRPAPADSFPAAREGSVTSGVVTGRSSPSVAASAEARRRCQVLSSMALRGRRSLDLDGRRLLQPGGLCLT